MKSKATCPRTQQNEPSQGSIRNPAKILLSLFKYYAAKQWNMLPEEVRDKAGTKDFIKRIRNLDF